MNLIPHKVIPNKVYPWLFMGFDLEDLTLMGLMAHTWARHYKDLEDLVDDAPKAPKKRMIIHHPDIPEGNNNYYHKNREIWRVQFKDSNYYHGGGKHRVSELAKSRK
ncbi:MAG: hypothetical protein HVN35_02300 [Methanobacteriaceae archaeon]|nr:hypothetical protein [Methanobacteriaceae archaeon]